MQRRSDRRSVPSPLLQAEVRDGSGGHAHAVAVSLAGELDASTVGELRRGAAWLDGADEVVLDLRGLTFVDSTGLGAVVALLRRIDRSTAVSIRCTAGPVSRLLHLTGVDRLVSVDVE